MHISLVIMAAGLGSRYGGSKQVDGIGPNGEILMEYSIHDALRAGFDKVVFIIKPEMQEMMDGLVGYLKQKKTADGRPVEVAFVYQDFTSVPSFYRIPEERTKPFGTVHALLCAEPAVDGPFCVINADDYYGVDAYRTIYEELGKLAPSGESCKKFSTSSRAVSGGTSYSPQTQSASSCGVRSSANRSKRNRPTSFMLIRPLKLAAAVPMGTRICSPAISRRMNSFETFMFPSQFCFVLSNAVLTSLFLPDALPTTPAPVSDMPVFWRTYTAVRR